MLFVVGAMHFGWGSLLVAGWADRRRIDLRGALQVFADGGIELRAQSDNAFLSDEVPLFWRQLTGAKPVYGFMGGKAAVPHGF